jgi:hypothetical protein
MSLACGVVAHSAKPQALNLMSLPAHVAYMLLHKKKTIFAYPKTLGGSINLSAFELKGFFLIDLVKICERCIQRI